VTELQRDAALSDADCGAKEKSAGIKSSLAEKYNLGREVDGNRIGLFPSAARIGLAFFRTATIPCGIT